MLKKKGTRAKSPLTLADSKHVAATFTVPPKTTPLHSANDDSANKDPLADRHLKIFAAWATKS